MLGVLDVVRFVSFIFVRENILVVIYIVIWGSNFF